MHETPQDATGMPQSKHENLTVRANISVEVGSYTAVSRLAEYIGEQSGTQYSVVMLSEEHWRKWCRGEQTAVLGGRCEVRDQDEIDASAEARERFSRCRQDFLWEMEDTSVYWDFIQDGATDPLDEEEWLQFVLGNEGWDR